MTRRMPLGAPAAVAALGALIAVLAYGVLANRGDGLDAAVAGRQRPAAPALALPMLTGGGARSLEAWRGHVVVVNFWASWCDPCREEAPLLERWQRRLARQGATVLGVDALDVRADALAFIRRYRLTYPMLRDRDGGAARGYGTRGYPETFVVDRRGRVAALRRGPVDDAFLRRTVSPLLREPA